MEATEESKANYQQPLPSQLAGDAQLNFRIFHCSSQDAHHVITELTNMNRDPLQIKGWQSQRFCIYPQELILQFQCPVHINQIKLLAHETKIASKVELFSYMPGVDGEQPGQMPGISSLVTPATSEKLFNRIGHFCISKKCVKAGIFQALELNKSLKRMHV